MSDRVWRGWARWNEREKSYASTKHFAPTLTNNIPDDNRLRSAYMKNCKPIRVVLIDAADYDAMLAELERLRAKE